MGAESGYLQLLDAFWEWVQKDIGLWIRTIGSLKDVLAERNLENNDTVLESLRLSAFSILIAIVMDVAAEAIFTNHPFSIIYGISLAVVYYISTLGYVIAIKITSIVVVSAQTMRKCFVMALFMTVYWPLNNLGEFIIYDDKNFAKVLVGQGATTTEEALRPSYLFDTAIFVLLMSAVAIFIFLKLVSAIKYVFRVGLVRAVIATVGIAAISSLIQFGPMLPLYGAITKRIFGA